MNRFMLRRLSAVMLSLLLASCSDDSASPVQTEAAPDTLSADSRPVSCDANADISYMCGITNGEDILQIGGTPWVLVSGMDGSLTGGDINGRLHLVNSTDHSFEVLFPGSNPVFRQDESLFSGCPGPLDSNHFSAHGLALRKIDKGPELYHLYMTSHGAREAIEVFEVDAFLKPTIKWVGCIPMPESSWTNSVTILSDGGFMATQFYNPALHTIEDVFNGVDTGHIFEWHPGQDVTVQEGTQGAGPNGIVISDDQRFVFMSAFGTGEVVRFDRSSTPPEREAVQVGIYPDNIRWTDQGKLYAAGSNTPDYCGTESCEAGWSVVEITPYNLAMNRVGGAGEDAALHDASSALPVGDEIWVGTFSGDRIAILPRP